jgi:putative DNA primase/helicase
MDFHAFAAAHGLAIKHLIADGRIHRTPTQDKPRSDNGAYLFDGTRGWVQDWAQGDEVQWWRDERAPAWTPAEKAKVAAGRRRMAEELSRQRHKAALQARQMVGEAELLIPRPERHWRPGRPAQSAIHAHPYLVSKGFPEVAGLVSEGVLLVPMFDCLDYRQMIGVQRIIASGEKRFLPGQRAKGAVHRLGAGGASEVWLCEGYATGLSVRAALKRMYRPADVVVCFSASNIVYVASRGVGTHVMADHDASATGEEAASATGLCWTMPPERGTDANDLMLSDGVGSVCELMQRRS